MINVSQRTARATSLLQRPALVLVALDGLILVCLVLSGLRLTAGLEAVVDLGLFDETGYLYAGTHLPSFGLMPPAWAPLYGVWYYGLSHLQPDPVALYYLNYRVLAAGAPALLYLLLRSYRLPRLFALPVAWCFLLSVANLPVWPKPGSFALCLMLLLLLAARDLRAPTRSVLLLGVGSLVCSYVRPEYLLASGLLFGLYSVLLWRGRGGLKLRNELAQLIAALAATLVLISIFSLAPLDRTNNRSFEAFAQHYAINWSSWNQRPLDPWTEFDVAIADSFGPAQGLGEAARANPAALGRHVATNIARYPGELARTFLQHFNPLLPADAPWAAPAGAWLLGLSAAGALLWATVQRRHELRERLRAQKLQLTIFALLAAPALSSAVIIYPRTHYLLLHGVLLVLVAGLLLRGTAVERPRAALLSLGVAVVLLALTPPITATWYAALPQTYAHPNRSTVEFIRALQITEPTAILEDEGGFHVYLGDQFRRVSAELKASGTYDFLESNEIDLIVVSAKLRQDKRFAADPEWQALLASPGSAGFVSLPIPGTDRTLLYRAPE